MRQREPGDRLRVVIAGNIYATRALVRRFLEDDGFDVVGEALAEDDLLAMADLARTDAVVVDGDLVDGSVQRLRALAPDAAIVVFTGPAGTGGSAPPGADGYLEKGVGLASLTGLLHALLSETPPLPLGLAWTEPAPQPQTERRVLAGLAGVAASIVLVAVVALAVFGGVGPSPAPGPAAGPTAPGSPPPSAPNARELALGDLNDLRDALAAGRPIQATWIVDALQQDLLAAQDAGFSVSGVGATAARLLHPFLGELAPDLLADLRSLFGSVFDVPTAPSGPTGGSTSDGTASGSGSGSTEGSASGSTSGSTSGGTTTDGGSGGDATGGGAGGGGGSGGTGGSGGGGGSGGSGGDGGGTAGPASHGNGHHYGWANKPPDGGWHGTKPHPHDHGKGNGKRGG
jgi:hypothetical protein